MATAKKDSNALTLRQRGFLVAFAQIGSIAPAARLAKIHRSDHFRWMQKPEYALAFETAREEAIEHHEGEIYRRGVLGILKPIFYKGRKIATIREYSDNLLMFRTKALAPEKYRDNVNLTGSITVDLAERLNKGRERVAKASQPE